MEPSTLLRAVSFAARKHSTQRRKDPDASPYINHPISVAALITEVGGVTDQATIIAAILHDTVEDTETSLSELVEEFGSEVAGIVAEMTDDKSLLKAERKELQIMHAPRASTAAKIIKLADKICNVVDISVAPPSDWDVSRRVEYLAWSTAVIHGCRGTNEELESRFDSVLASGCNSLGIEVSEIIVLAGSMRESASSGGAWPRV